MTELYKAEEVKKHNAEKDLWIVIHGGVYDLTKFAKEHPGGEEILIELAGQDGSQCFDDIGHSGEAIKLRESFKIGVVNEPMIASTTQSSAGVQNTATNDDDDDWVYQEAKKERSPSLKVVIGAGVAIYAIIFYYFFYS